MELPLRRALFWLHLGIAVTAGAVILLLAATGLLLAFEAQIQEVADGADRRVESPATESSLSLERTLAAVRVERPELAVSGATLRRDPGEAAILALGRDGVVYVDPHHDRIVGAGAERVRRFFRAVTDLHRYLAASGERRDAGKTITGSATLLFLAVLLSGLYLWVPRVFGGTQLRNALWFRREVSRKARDFNWHHVFGIWALVPLVLIVASALPISFDWANRLVLSAAGDPPQEERRASPRGPEPARGSTSSTPKLGELELAGIDGAVAAAVAAEPDWRAITVRLPARPDGALTLTIDRAKRRGRPDLRSQLTVATSDGTVISHESFDDLTRGRRTRSWMRWLHTGEIAGLAGQAIAAAACAAVLMLGWTGYALALRRLRAWRLRRAEVSVVASAARLEPNPVASIAAPPHAEG